MPHRTCRRVCCQVSFCLLALVAVLLTSTARAQQWTRFRGPNGSGISEDTSIPTTWTEADYRWKFHLPGSGHSSPVIWGDKVFVTSAEKSDGMRYVICLDTKSGDKLWQKEFKATTHHTHAQNSMASSTPAVDAKRLYVAWATPEQFVLLALDHKGNQLWRQDDLGGFTSQHGFGASPVVVDDVVVITDDQEGESFLIGVGAADGKIRYKIPRRSAPGNQNTSYATPCLREVDGKKELIVHSWGQGITAIDPASGSTNWELASAFARRPVSSPILVGDMILGSCGEGGGNNYVIAVHPPAKSQAAEVAFKLDRSISPYVPCLLAKDNLVFLWSDKGIVSCIDSADNGKVVWTKRVGGNFSCSPIRIGARLYNISSDGDVYVLSAGDKFEQLGKISLGETCRATPAVANGTLFLRTESQLFAVGKK